MKIRQSIIYSIIFIVFLISSCYEVLPPPVKISSDDIREPVNPTPGNGVTDVKSGRLSWEFDDSKGSATFDVYYGDADSNLDSYDSHNTENTYYDITVRAGEKYKWKVVAIYNDGFEAESDIWTFDASNIKPNNPIPADNSTNVDYNVLSWSFDESISGEIIYTVYKKEIDYSSYYDYDNIIEDSLEININSNTDYEWYIKAECDNGFISEGDVWTFSTVDNFPPGVPYNPDPTYLEYIYVYSGSPNLLEWSCSDPDDYSLTYSLYLGTSSDPSLYATNIMSSYIYVYTLVAGVHYYWKIVAFDEHGASTEGPVWRFTTY